MSETGYGLNALPDPGDPHAIVREFAANPAFRAAEWSELTTEDNPFRRPVRPDDLDWLDYSRPLAAENALKLSGLLGHRMLRNIYDLDQLMLAPTGTRAALADRATYYSTRNRVLSAMARPVLEHHLFTHLAELRPAHPVGTLGGLRALVLEEYERRSAEPVKAIEAARAARGSREAATFLLLQYSAFTPAGYTAVARNAVGEFDLPHRALRSTLLGHYQRWAQDSDRYTELLAAAELLPAPGAYWQMYLNSSLARGNHLHHLAANQELVFSFLGAFLFQLLDSAVTAERYAEVFENGLGVRPEYFEKLQVWSRHDLAALVDTLVEPFSARFGRTVVEQVHAGFAEAAHLADLWDRDLAAQLSWADSIEVYQERAERIQRHIDDEELEIDLDTFVESWEVTSTTHVHDDHRLVVIESGQMHFWNNVTHKIELNAGDKLLIPLSRLHGSTVLSGECTYHQPIIPETMYRAFVREPA